MTRSKSTVIALAVSAVLFCVVTLARASAVSTEHDGIELLGELQLAPDSTLSDGVVLIVHGTLAHHRMELIANLQSLLGERGINTLAITLSHGQSARRGMYDCAAAHSHRPEDTVGEINHWMDWLHKQGALRVLLAGHSRGANQAARYTIRYQSRLRALALIAPSTFDSSRASSAYERRYSTALEEVIQRAREAPAEQWIDGVGFLHCPAARVTAQSFLSYYADDGKHDTPTLLATIASPTLIIAGSADQTVPDVPQRTKPFLDDNTKLVVIEDANHFFQDLYGEDLADAIATFAGEYLR